jgi:hypothetical protein
MTTEAIDTAGDGEVLATTKSVSDSAPTEPPFWICS